MGRFTGKPTLADVAARAGVSRTTASYVLNGRSREMRISSGAVQRVRRAVEELGYRPNRTARDLRTAETRTVGVVSDRVASGQFASRLLSGASAAARGLDHLLMVGEGDGDPRLEQVIAEQMVDQGVGGVLYATLHHREVSPPPVLRSVRTVLLNCVDREGLLPAVVPDEHGGGRRAGELLAGVPGEVVVLGDEREQGTRAGRLRLGGLAERLAEDGRAVAAVLRCEWDVLAARRALETWWADGGRAGAVVCMNDRVAMGASQALASCRARAGGPSGDGVVLVSFDGSALADWLDPPVPSVGIPFEELGATAVRLLLDPDGPPAGVLLLPMTVRDAAAVRGAPGRAGRG